MKLGLASCIFLGLLIAVIIFGICALILDLHENYRDHSDDPNYISDAEFRNMHADDPEETDDDIYYW